MPQFLCKKLFNFSIVLFSITTLVYCNKLDTTDIGLDAIPAVDNINTFADTISVTTKADKLPITEESFNSNIRVLQSSALSPVIGKVTNSYYGNLDAKLALQFKPSFFPFFWGSGNDTIFGPNVAIKLDSVILAIDYQGAWGDTMQNITLNIKELNTIGNNTFSDSIYKNYFSFPFSYFPVENSTIIGSKTFNVSDLNTRVYTNHKKTDSATRMIRIKITDAAFINKLFHSDTSLTPPFGVYANPNPNLRFASNENFSAAFKGLSISASSSSGDVLIYSNILSTKTRLEVHYVKKNGGKYDTTSSGIQMLSGGVDPNTYGKYSTYANQFTRNFTGSNYLTTNKGVNDNSLHIYTQPLGTFANITLNNLSSLAPTSVIHRAELIVQPITDAIYPYAKYPLPSLLYLDARYQAGVDSFRTLPLSLNSFEAYLPEIIPPINYADFGGIPFKINGVQDRYTFNITRYLQKIITNQDVNYQLRLSAPSVYKYNAASLISAPALINNHLAGFVKIGGGNHPTHKMMVRVVYSKS